MVIVETVSACLGLGDIVGAGSYRVAETGF